MFISTTYLICIFCSIHLQRLYFNKIVTSFKLVLFTKLSWKILTPTKKSLLCQNNNMIITCTDSKYFSIFQSGNWFWKAYFGVSPLKNSHHYLSTETKFPFIYFIATFRESSISCWGYLRIVRSWYLSILIPYLWSFYIISWKFTDRYLLNQLFPRIKSFFH